MLHLHFTENLYNSKGQRNAENREEARKMGFKRSECRNETAHVRTTRLQTGWPKNSDLIFEGVRTPFPSPNRQIGTGSHTSSYSKGWTAFNECKATVVWRIRGNKHPLLQRQLWICRFYADSLYNGPLIFYEYFSSFYD